MSGSPRGCFGSKKCHFSPPFDFRVCLYHFVQLSRFRKVRLEGEQPISDLDTMLLKGEGFLDQLVLGHSTDHKVLWLQLPEGYGFFFPELGSFQFPVEDPGCVTGWTYGYAVPLTPFVALASVS